MNKIVFYQSNSIWTANYDGSGQQKININLPSGYSLYTWVGPKISPNGKKIFFIGYNTSSKVNYIFSCNIDGSNVVPIIQNDAYEWTLTGGTDHRGNMNISAIKWKLPEPYKGEPEVKAELSSNIIRAGNPLTVRALCDNPKSKPVMVMQNFVDSNEVLPGFEYDVVREIAWIGTNTVDNKIQLFTDEWRAGVHFFSVIDQKKYSADHKDIAITVREENPQYETEEIKNYKSRIIPLVRLPDGLVLASGGFSSKDGGVTWDKDREEVRGNRCLLRSSEIFILSSCKINEKKGHYIRTNKNDTDLNFLNIIKVII